LNGDEKRKAIAEWLEADLRQAFEAALNPPKRDPDEKKLAIARLLIPLSEVFAEDEPAPAEAPKQAEPAYQRAFDSPAYRRTLLVVGETAAVRALNEEAAELKKVAQDVDTAMATDRAVFADAYRLALNRSLARLNGFAVLVEWQQGFLDFQKGLAEEHGALVKTRRAEVSELEKELARLQDVIRTKLKAQIEKEREVLVKQQQLRDAYRQNQELAREARELEQSATKGKAQ
jgi:hypothetical protein